MVTKSFQKASKEKLIEIEKKLFPIGLLIEKNQIKKAKICIELLIREENLIEVYEILRLDCEILIDNIQLIKNSSIPPYELLFTISRLLYSSNRINNNNIPELINIRNYFIYKYGMKCIDSVENNISKSNIHHFIVSKLSIDPPPEKVVIDKYLQRICYKFQINLQNLKY